MRDAAKLALALVLLAALFGGGLALSCVHYRECRRVHPWWYCAGEGGR